MATPLDSTPKVRTRFPPSPTGALHLGGARTALFNWLFARHHGGEFVLRLEDTDRKRSKDEHVESIMEAMDWLGLDWDLGPYYQTKRFERYRQAIDQMLKDGRAYWCHCSPEELQKQRDEAAAQGKKPMYQGKCRDKNLGPAEGAVVRFRGPCTGATEYLDLVKGPISFNNEELDDLVILRSDGSPTYHLAVVVDDIDMGITHVIRGDDHVNNTPRQILLFQALNAALPKFAHIPMILGPDKAKLSKRHGATSVVAYREMGYLAEGMINALARLGWSHGDQEMFSVSELIEYFDLDAVGKSPAVFDADKLQRINARYMQSADPKRLLELVEPLLSQKGITLDDNSRQVLLNAIPELVPRTPTLVDLAHWAEHYVVERPEMEPKAVKKVLKPQSADALERVKDIVLKHGVMDTEAMEGAFRALAEEMEVGLGKIAQPVRVSLTGRTASPGIFEVMAILGPKAVTKRLDWGIEIARSRGEST